MCHKFKLVWLYCRCPNDKIAVSICLDHTPWGCGTGGFDIHSIFVTSRCLECRWNSGPMTIVRERHIFEDALQANSFLLMQPLEIPRRKSGPIQENPRSPLNIRLHDEDHELDFADSVYENWNDHNEDESLFLVYADRSRVFPNHTEGGNISHIRTESNRLNLNTLRRGWIFERGDDVNGNRFTSFRMADVPKPPADANISGAPPSYSDSVIDGSIFGDFASRQEANEGSPAPSL